MYLRNSPQYGKQIRVIHPGEFHVSDEDEMIGTLLGSCVALCLYDPETGIGGMNHFMLPGRISSSDIFSDRSARYGITAVNRLFSLMEGHGVLCKNFKAKIFGGGHVLETAGSASMIPEDNVRLARIMMEMEDIPITQSDVGGIYTRKLLFEVRTGKVYLKRSTRQDVNDLVGEREKYFINRSAHEG